MATVAMNAIMTLVKSRSMSNDFACKGCFERLTDESLVMLM